MSEKNFLKHFFLLNEKLFLFYYKFYYTYPDYKFATNIYYDEYLPKKGELRNNMRNFDSDRLLLFDEGLAFDGIIDAELFPHFSNSFFVEIGKKEEHHA